MVYLYQFSVPCINMSGCEEEKIFTVDFTTIENFVDYDDNGFEELVDQMCEWIRSSTSDEWEFQGIIDQIGEVESYDENIYVSTVLGNIEDESEEDVVVNCIL